MRALLLKWQTLIIFAAAFSGCSRNSSLFEKINGSSQLMSDSEISPAGLRLQPYYEGFSGTTTQGQYLNKVDLAIAYDNSPNMQPYIDQIKANVPTLFSQLESYSIDFQAGVFHANCAGDFPVAGSFYLQGPTPVIKSSDVSPGAEVQANFQSIQSSFNASQSDQEGVYLLLKAPTYAQNNLLFRSEAAKAFIDLSNEDGEEATDFAETFGTFTKLAGKLPWIFSALGNPTYSPCSGDANGGQFLQTYLSSVSGGIIGRVCESDYTTYFIDLASRIKTILTEVSVTQIASPSASRAPVAVFLAVDNVSIALDPISGFQWNAAKNAIFFPGTYRPSPGAALSVTLEYMRD